MTPFKLRRNKTAPERIIKSALTLKLLSSIATDLKTTINPIPRPMLHMVEPTAFPIAMSAWPFKAAIKLTRNSGAVVAKLTIVAPMTAFGM